MRSCASGSSAFEPLAQSFAVTRARKTTKGLATVCCYDTGKRVSMAVTRRRLEDLYITGKELIFDDGNGDPVVVWLQKLNPIEMGSCMRRASASRARVISVKNDTESDDYKALWSEVLEVGATEKGLVDYLVAEVVISSQEVAEAKLGAEDEWSKESYLQGLRDAWEDGLKDNYAVDPEDVEALRVHDELKRFSDAATLIAEEMVADSRAETERKSRSELQEAVMERVIQYRGNAAWLDEFHRAQLWLGVREPKNHRDKYFSNRDIVESLSGPVLTRLLTEYQALSVDISEGKDSRQTPDSSPSSEPSLKEATPVSSGPGDAAQ